MPHSPSEACFALAGVLMLGTGLALAATPTPAETLLAKLAKTPPVSTPFVQVSYRAVLDRPLVVSGTMRWLGGERMQRDIVKPFKETAKIGQRELSVQRGDGAIHRVPLTRVPQASAMLTGFRALMGGDAAALEKDFALSVSGDDSRWVITLTPRTDLLKQRLVAIMIDGRNTEPRCISVFDTNGDSSVTLVGAMAKTGLRRDAPQEPALTARCRNGQ